MTSHDDLAGRFHELRPLDEHNRELVDNVHPPDWINPEPKAEYDMVVVGAGAAGLITAAGCAGLGARVALVERRLLGGDCLNVGCVPSKALISAARRAHDVHTAGDYGVVVPDGVRVDFGAVMERLRRLRAKISPNDSAARFRDLGIDVFIGQGTFTAKNTVEVAGKTSKFIKATIATGARAVELPIPGLSEAGGLTNESVFSLTELPARLAVIGAGPIGCELAQSFARFGSKVTILEVAPQILIREDPDAARIVQDALIADGVDLRCGVQIERIERDGDLRRVIIKDGDPVEADHVLVSVGRAPNTKGLGLEQIGVAFDRRGVTVNERLETTVSDIYAAGDICFPYKFTHVADALARIVIRNAFFPGSSSTSALTIPWCTYTDPEIAHVGMYGKDAEAAGVDYETIEIDLEHNDRAILEGEEGILKVHVKKGKGTILGATLVSRHAGETISQITTAMAAGMSLGDLGNVIHPYPTQAEAIKRAGDAFDRTRLTPFKAWLLKKLIARHR